ncbi:hemopexin repeat-containing protein [Nonomuraea wenchangensis]
MEDLLRDDTVLPSYERLFGELDFRREDESRSVSSPAAYLADLLRLLEDNFESPSLLRRRPDLADVVLDAENTYAESPYLDIVVEVLERLMGADPYESLRTLAFPFDKPFSLQDERLRRLLAQAGIAPEEFYRLFAATVDADTVAREVLGLTAEEAAALTTPLTSEAALRERYGLGGEALTVLRDVGRFRRATMLTVAELRELLSLGDGAVGVDAEEDELVWGEQRGEVPFAWFEEVNRFLRLARGTGLALTDLHRILRDCAAGRLDRPALRAVAAVVHLHRTHDLPIDVVCSLVADMEAGGAEPAQDLFSRTFDDGQSTVIWPWPGSPPDGRQPLRCPGDILAAHNREYRRRVAVALSLAEDDLAGIVTRYRARYAATPLQPSPFDQTEIGLPALSLLHRVARLGTALGMPVSELFDVLLTLESDPAPNRYAGFRIPVDTRADADPPARDCLRMLEAGDARASLWLVQTLFAVGGWLAESGLSGPDLLGVLGPGAPEDAAEQVAVMTDLYREFEAVEFGPGLFASGRFGERAAEVLHNMLARYDEGVVSPRDSRVLRLDPEEVAAAAHDALSDLSVLAPEDFLGLGLDERLTRKIFTGLSLTGQLGPDGLLDEARLPGPGAQLRLSHDLRAHREAVFTLLGARTTLYPSTLEALPGLGESERAELYDNLIYQGYLSQDGEILRVPDELDGFEVDADLGDLAPAVLDRLRERVSRFRGEPLALDPEIFAGLPLDAPRRAALLDNLRFTGCLDRDGRYADKAALTTLTPDAFGLAPEFRPYRHGVLAAMRRQVEEFRTELYTFLPEDFQDIADDAVARRVLDELGTTRSEAADAGLLGPWFTDDERAVVAGRLTAVEMEALPYRLDVATLGELGFRDGEIMQLAGQLVAAGHLDARLTVPVDRLAFFANPANALGFALPGLADYSADLFYLLHAAAVRMSEGVEEVTAALAALAEQQSRTLYAVLQDAFGVPAETAEAICTAIIGGPAETLDVLLAPVLAAGDAAEHDRPVEVPADPRFRHAYRRTRRFARLAAKLGLDATEVGVAFHDQDLTGRFAEPLALPPGVDRFDALLSGSDGKLYLFRGEHYWVYSALTYALADPAAKPLTDLSPRLAGLSVDAAFTDARGAEWIVGHDAGGRSRAFVKEPGSLRWAAREQVWGKVRNNFADPARIDGAFVDDAGRTYLFCGDQYVRYSGTGYDVVDEGYPRRIGEWWEGEAGVPLPPAFRRTIDAGFQDRDGRTHLFSGDRFVTVGDPAGDRPITGTWGVVRNSVAGAERLDAAYADGAGVYLFRGDQVVAYTDNVETDGVHVADGYPRRVASHFPGVPAEFEGSLEAAFAGRPGEIHLFKDGRTVTLGPQGPGPVVPTAERWGLLGDVLGGRVDAAFTGMDGRTYLFSGERYLRYSSADYSVADAGYPRAIDGDWGGLRRVDAAFVLDGETHLFGAAGRLFEVPIVHAADLDAGRLGPELRRRFLEHGVSFGAGVRVEARDQRWHVTAEQDVRLVLTPRREPDRIVVEVAADAPATFHVKYATRDYTTPDAGHPRPLAGNWWNLPVEAGFTTVDAVFTGADGRTYLFRGGSFIVFDARHRWWSEPRTLAGHWDSLPFKQVDAAFVGLDGRTYVFSGAEYARYSTADYTRLDDRYPAPVRSLWGKVANSIARTGRVDAALVAGFTEKVDGTEVVRTHTYLFSGDQYVRYENHDYTRVQDGYPRPLSELAGEPRLRNLPVTLDGVDAAYADRRTVYLFRGTSCHAVSDTLYRRYDDLGLPPISCAFTEDGAVLAQTPGGWARLSALEGPRVSTAAAVPRVLRGVPAEFRDGLDAVLRGADDNTYLFKGDRCFNVRLNRAYPLLEEWGRPRDNVYHHNAVDAALVGVDGRTYLFSGDQFVTYGGVSYAEADGEPRRIAEHWGGLASVALAYVREGRTYVFEHAGADGSIRYLVYSGTDYLTLDPGYPRSTDAGFWGVPEEYRAEGFGMPDAVLFEGGSMLLLRGELCLPRDEVTGRWSYPRPIERVWPGFEDGLEAGDALRTAFTGRDGGTYFFFTEEYAVCRDGAFSARAPVGEGWGRSRTGFSGLSARGRVDAAFVHRGKTTYLFSGDRYVRYTGTEYRYADDGYPRPIAGNLRREEPFANLAESFEDALADRVAAGSARLIDAVVATDRTVHLLVGGEVHAVSQEAAATYDLGLVGRVRNAVAERGRVDAALVDGTTAYLFSGDQYVRYSGRDHLYVDEGYPRTIAGSLAGDLGLRQPLPPEFHDGIDAAFRGRDGVHLFRGRSHHHAGRTLPVAGSWGRVANTFEDGRALDAAFAAPTGELYAFKGGQYVRYRPGELEYAEEGYPRTIKDDWGDLPADFEPGIDGAFVFEGRTYLLKGDRYVRYSGRYDAVDRTFPQPLRDRWAEAADYRLDDVHLISRFAALARAHRPGAGGLAAFLAAGPGVVEDPYRHLSDLFGWDAEEVRWVRRTGVLAPPGEAGDRFEIELILRLVELFAAAGKLGAGPSALHRQVWSRVHGPAAGAARAAELARAADVLHDLVVGRHDPQDRPGVARRLHDELNVRKRDALVTAVLSRPAADGEPDLRTSRDLFGHLLVDVDMGAQGSTSRVREAIAATQLYLHRYFLDLEPAAPRRAEPAGELRRRLKGRWGWMRTYRVWEANRKVFLYPENYLRPELRDTKTPAFAELEDDLLQGEITPEAAQRAYKRYLDEYTEVSRLAIAGGYVFPPAGADTGARNLVLFGRTRTTPRRFYFRRAEFGAGERLSGSWGPWLKVQVQIDADKVYPIHAFGRVFVFWVVAEAVPESESEIRRKARICYSFQNLNQEWTAAQVLGTGELGDGGAEAVVLSVRSAPRPGGPADAEDGGEDDVIVVSYALPAADPAAPPVTTAFALTPELYALPVTGEPPRAAGLDGVAGTLAADEAATVEASGVVHVNRPGGSPDGQWLSIDHKGGSFLSRPLIPAPDLDAGPVPLDTEEAVQIPAWPRIDAAFELPSTGTRYFFDNEGGRWAAMQRSMSRTAVPAQRPIQRWGRPRNNLTQRGLVTGVLRRAGHTFVLSGDQYFRFSGEPFGPVDPGYPKAILGNQDDLPQWRYVDAAFATPGGVEYFFSAERNRFVRSGALTAERTLRDGWALPRRSGGDDYTVADLRAAYVRGGDTYLVFRNHFLRYTGDRYDTLGEGNPFDHEGETRDVRAALDVGEDTYLFTGTVHVRVSPQGRQESGLLTDLGTHWRTIDAAFLREADDTVYLYLTSGKEFVRYTVGRSRSVPEVVDEGYPKPMERPVKAVFQRGGRQYVFAEGLYTVLDAGQELDAATGYTPTAGNWGELPGDFTGMLDTGSDLYVFRPGAFYRHPHDAESPRPYTYESLQHEIVRLTTSTAYKLNQRLLTGGVAALLDPATQETDELPAFATDRSDATTVRVNAEKVERMPTSSYLDFQSANSVYYWEIFCHAPLLIAQALNNAQRFDDARQWYEHVFDPGDPVSYWRFLPFLAVDTAALAEACAAHVAELAALEIDTAGLTAPLGPILTRLTGLAPAFRARRLTGDDIAYLKGLAGSEPVGQIGAALDAITSAAARPAVDGLRERLLMIEGLGRQYDLSGDSDGLLRAYLDDPFDPHAIARLRPVAYRRAVVMAYVDNLLDWGDLLFRQYTAESVDEARMLYILAHDLLGERAESLGILPRPAGHSYAGLVWPGEGGGGDAGEQVREITVDGALLTGAGVVHEGVTVPYFHIPVNELFAGYWDRVADRLRKIRQSLDIMGVSRPVPLFEPPIDPALLVQGVAAGLEPGRVAAERPLPVPHHRFTAVHRRAQELAEKVRSFGAALLDTLERRDAEELALLHTTHEEAVLGMTRAVREAQVRIAAQHLKEAEAGRDAVSDRIDHFQQLIADGLSPLQEAQISMMSLASATHLTGGGLKVGAAIAYGAPGVLLGPFITGVKYGGDQVGDALDQTAGAAEALGEGLSVLGELLGVRAEHERAQEDWQLQLRTAQNDLVQAGHQLAAAADELAVAQRELEILDKESAHQEAVTRFMKEKFGGAELYRWLAGRLAGLYYQAYDLAYETARSAERAFQFERGVPEGEVAYIRPVYWESRRNGLLAGESLGLDLDRLGKAYQDGDERGLEITKRVSLRELDPVALLALKSARTCEFALTETLFDHDFPGHYRRQIKTVSVAFEGPDGRLPLNATLRQTGHRTVLAADAKAVKHLLDPKGPAPASLRHDWRPSQRIALSHVEQGQDGNGLFELRYDDERYLPFEGTGAVSTWRLELTGRRRSEHADELQDVVITVRYTAREGDEVFANTVKGLLKPYPAARWFDVAAEFPEQWAAFAGDGDSRLVLPFTPDMFPDMAGPQISGVTAAYALDGRGTARATIGGDGRLALNDGVYLATPGLSADGDWTLVVDGDKAALKNIGLVLTYKAGVR